MLFIVSVAYFLKFMKEQLNNEDSWHEFKANRSEAELKLLKQQLNPHFLFNTLNSIYAKCIENRVEAGEMIVQLADMLRFQLEHDGNEKIALENEIGFLDNYIFFEKGRLNKSISINYSKNIVNNNNNLQIAPNLLITLVENAFKHSTKLEAVNQIEITINCENETIELMTKNTFKPYRENNSTQIGLENLRKRLDYLYEGKYILNNRIKENYYYATLKINL
jgi:LytS/YehU family sensor histidine kinase